MSTRSGWAASRCLACATGLCSTVLVGIYLCQSVLGQTSPDWVPSTSKAKPYALIYGTVYGSNDRAVYGVRVKIRRANEKRARWELYSDHRGEFAQRVPAGAADYVVWADVRSRKGAAMPEAKVHIQNDERQDISLHLTE